MLRKKILSILAAPAAIYIILSLLTLLGLLIIPFPVSLAHLIGRPLITTYAGFTQADPSVLNISEFCSVEAYDFEDKIECVVMQVAESYNYTFQDRPRIFKTPEHTLRTGGVCRDYALIYSSVFRNLGMETDFAFTKDHVFNIVWDDDIYCTVDQTQFECY